MKKYIFLTIFSTILLVNCDFLSPQKKNEKDAYVINNYNKKEVDIVMRDGTNCIPQFIPLKTITKHTPS